VHASSTRYDFPRASVQLVDLNLYDVSAPANAFALTLAEYFFVESLHLDQTVILVQTWWQAIGQEVELVNGGQKQRNRVGISPGERTKIVLRNIYRCL